MSDYNVNTEETVRTTTQPAAEPRDNYIVAIGASAGGLEAIHSFFDNLTESNNLAFIIIQHLSPDYKSLLVELVAKHTHLSVFEAEHNIEVKPNCIYVIPPKMLMTIADGRLQLSEKKTGDKSPNTAIDTFLRTLAIEKEEKAIAIILSGTGTDGTRGAEAIKNSGGVVMVQDPSSARFDGMPRSATAHADYVLTPEQMPAEIYNHIQEVPTNIFKKGKVDEHLLEEVFRLLFKHTGCDFHYYKLPTLLRRISRRMMQHGFKVINDYIAHLQQHPEECKILCKDFLIGVTRFFRDQAAFDVLRDKVIPALVRDKEDGDILKIWICACSTGEEAYSIAILVNECLLQKGKSLNVKIFATDIDASAIEKASKGGYPLSIAKDIPADLLEKYFTKEGRKYCVVPHIRKQIVFARHNIISDPPFIKNDLITCRNMLIYMNSSLQKKILNTLLFSLQKDSFLFLGSSETISVMRDQLEEVDRKWKIYRKIDGIVSRNFSHSFRSELPMLHTSQFKVDNSYLAKSNGKSLAEELREVVIEDFGYAALYIDKNYEIKEAIGDFRRYLSLPEHTLNLNILKMVPIELATALGSAIRKAWKNEGKVYLPKVKVREKGRVRTVSIVIRPPQSNSGFQYTLVIFGEAESEVQQPIGLPGNGIAHEGDSEYILQLKEELKETKMNLQTAIESLETANEELQSSNEELLSSNEELQSSNEELQSLNEELHTLNTEHQLKINELIELNDDLNNYFRSIDIGQIFLDRKLRIRKFNPSSVKLINLIESDIGRPFGHISTNLSNENLIADIEGVLRSGNVVEKEVTLLNGRASLMRIFPYVRQDRQSDGVVITFVDITAMKNLNSIISAVFNATKNAILALKAVRDENYKIVDFQFLTANESAEQFYNKKRSEFIGKNLSVVFPSVIEKGLLDRYRRVVQEDITAKFEYPVKCNNKEGWWEITAVKMMDGVAITIADITEKREAEDKIKANYNELIRTREELKKLNSELEKKVQERTRLLAESEERFRLVSQATNDAIWDWDLVNNTIWLSNNYYSMFGYDQPDEKLKRKTWLDRVHPEDRPKVNESISASINNGSKQWTAEYRYQKANGEYAQILDRGYILHDEYGTPYRMLSSMLDVTQLRKTEQDYLNSVEQRKFLAESMPLIVWTATPTGRVNFLNNQFTSYTGINFKKAKGLGWEEVIHPEHLKTLKKIWKAAIIKRQDFSLEVMMRRHDGEYRWYLLRARAKVDESGKLLMWVGTNTDIHEQKMATAIMEQKVAERTLELKEINQQLELSNHDLQQFASVASHDLKEPLRKIHMFSQMLKDRYMKGMDEAGEYMDRIISSSERMTRLINDLLSFSRLSVDSFFEPVNVNSILDEVLSDLELAITERKAKIHVDEFPQIEGIPGQMRQIFQNIISNALKFTRKDVQPVIKIETARLKDKKFNSTVDENGNYLRIRISDNGIGFDNQFKDKIFTIFQRLHTRNEYEGTGIGLAICKKIVDKHDGIITAQSKEGQGSTFIIILPIKHNQQ